MLETLKELDKTLFLWLNGLHTPLSDVIFWTATQLTVWIPFYALILVLLIKKYGAKVLWVIFAIAFTILLADQFSNFCKNFFERLRPSHEPSLEGLVHLILQDNGEYYRGGRFGFISGHASNTFGIASFLFFLLRKQHAWISWLFAWALFVSYTRIAIGVHYPGDIVFGALAGFFFGWLSYRIMKIVYYQTQKKPFDVKNY